MLNIERLKKQYGPFLLDCSLQVKPAGGTGRRVCQIRADTEKYLISALEF